MLLVAFLSFIGMQAFAQTTITGTVNDANGEPVPGANVRVKGFSDVGTITDLNGSYSLSVPAGATALIFSFVGMQTQEIEIGGQTTISVTLQNEDVGIDEVVVTALGITREEKELGYGVQTVSSEHLSTSPNADMINSINGRTAGVQITSTAGTAGASTYITIRGAASLTGNNQPLFIVDGLPIITGGGTGGEGGTSVGGVRSSSRSIDINPDDIATMTVLKGGAATALYGVRAANGAIVITTKSGSANQKLQIDFHSSVGIDQISQVPDMQKQYSQGLNQVWISGHQTSWGANVDTLQYDVTTNPDYQWDPNGMIVGQSHPNANGIPVKTYDHYDFFQTGMTFNNTLGIRAGNEKSTYYFSIGNLSQEGIIPNNTYRRTSVKFNASTKLWDEVTVATNMSYSNSKANQIQQGSNTSGVMLGLLRTPPTFNNNDGYKFPDGTQRTYRHGGGYDNPYWTANENSFDDDTDRFIGSTNINYVATDWLKFTYNVGIDWYNRKVKHILAINSRNKTDGEVEEISRYARDFNSDLLMTLNKDFGDDISTSLTLGHNMYSHYYKSVRGYADGLSIPEFYQLSNTGKQESSSGINNYRTMAVFADLHVSYMDMVYLGATVRNDWATTMPEANRSALYPSVSLGFVFTELDMLKGNNILSFGKLRGSWAKTANIAGAYNTSNYFYQPFPGDGWTDGVSFPYMGNTGYQQGAGLGNPDLKHESMKSVEVGMELKFMNNRIGLDVAYFKNNNEDLLMRVPIAPSSGYDNVYMNAATMISEGSEWTLTATPVRTGGFQWDLMVNFTKFRNSVISLAEGVDNVSLGGFVVPSVRAVAGQEYRSVYGIDWARDANGNMLINDDPTDAHTDGFPFPNDAAGMVPIGNVNPDWTANMTNTLSYKGITFSFLIDVKHGGSTYNGTAFAMNFMGTHGRTSNRDVTYLANGQIDYANTPAENLVVYDGVLGHLDADGNVVTSGVTNTTSVVNDQNWYRGYGSNFGGGPSIGAMENGGWVRLREISLAYNFPKSIIGDSWLKGLEVYFVGKNLWIDTPYTGVDPETSLLGSSNAQGMDYFNMPGTKSYNFGLKLRF